MMPETKHHLIWATALTICVTVIFVSYAVRKIYEPIQPPKSALEICADAFSDMKSQPFCMELARRHE